MQHFFVKSDQIKDHKIYINGQDVNHIKNVLRMKIGEELEVNDGTSQTYLGSIKEISADEIIVEILSSTTSNTELSSKVYLFQGLPKGDKMELIVEKAVELGVTSIIPMETKRAIVKLDDKKKQKKVDKWNSVALAAAKQSARGCVPTVEPVMTIANALEKAKELNHVLVPYELAKGMEDTKKAIDKIKPRDSIGIFIGPEGGFDVLEIEKALATGAKPISLGSRILRTETAGITTLSILMYHLETIL